LTKRLNPDDFTPHSFTTKFKLEDFKCEDAKFEQYLIEEAYGDHNTNVGRVFLMIENSTQKVVGFVTLAMGNLPRDDESEEKPATVYPKIPGVLLGQLAAHADYRGMGTILLDFVFKHALELAQRIGCRVVYVNSVEGKGSWYERQGFTLVRKTKRTYFMDLFMDEPSRP
jgi:GNAT superfamily N-acetyltransferase